MATRDGRAGAHMPVDMSRGRCAGSRIPTEGFCCTPICNGGRGGNGDIVKTQSHTVSLLPVR